MSCRRERVVAHMCFLVLDPRGVCQEDDSAHPLEVASGTNRLERLLPRLVVLAFVQQAPGEHAVAQWKARVQTSRPPVQRKRRPTQPPASVLLGQAEREIRVVGKETQCLVIL